MGAHARVFDKEEARDLFLGIDVQQLRAHWLQHQVAPPGLTIDMEEETTVCEEWESGATCGYKGCDASFADRWRLQLHLRTAHGMRCLAFTCTPTDVCPKCSTVFTTRQGGCTTPSCIYHEGLLQTTTQL